MDVEPGLQIQIQMAIPHDLEQLLSSSKVSERERAVIELGKLANTSAITILSQIATRDKNSNLRKSAIQQLVRIDTDESISGLLRCLEGNTELFLKREVIVGLGKKADKRIIGPVVTVLLNNPPQKLGYNCIDCLFSIPFPDIVQAVSQIIDNLQPSLKAYLVKNIADCGDAKQAGIIKKYIEAKHDEKVRLAAISGLSDLCFDTFVALMQKSKNFGDNSIKIRQRIAMSLGKQPLESSISILWRLLCFDHCVEVKNEAVSSLHKSSVFEIKFKSLLDLLSDVEPARDSLEPDLLVQALLDNDSPVQPQMDKIAEKLILTASQSNKNIVPIMAVLLVSTADRNLRKAGAYIEQIQRIHKIDAATLEALRIDVGGESALGELFEKLEYDLKTYFQEPIHQLNTRTQIEWEKTIAAARFAFLLRVSMSCVVFIVGVGMLCISFYQFTFNDTSGTTLWGTGVSFVSGLGAMLLVIYTGPLKDIRQAVNDLGASNAAFIAYIHRILQISHTFSAKYLEQKITFEDTSVSCSLIGDAMEDTVSRLQSGNASSDHNEG